MVVENILIDLKHKLEVKARRRLLLHYSSLHKKLILRQFLYSLIMGELQYFPEKSLMCFTTINDSYREKLCFIHFSTKVY